MQITFYVNDPTQEIPRFKVEVETEDMGHVHACGVLHEVTSIANTPWLYGTGYMFNNGIRTTVVNEIKGPRFSKGWCYTWYEVSVKVLEVFDLWFLKLYRVQVTKGGKSSVRLVTEGSLLRLFPLKNE